MILFLPVLVWSDGEFLPDQSQKPLSSQGWGFTQSTGRDSPDAAAQQHHHVKSPALPAEGPHGGLGLPETGHSWALHPITSIKVPGIWAKPVGPSRLFEHSNPVYAAWKQDHLPEFQTHRIRMGSHGLSPVRDFASMALPSLAWAGVSPWEWAAKLRVVIKILALAVL